MDSVFVIAVADLDASDVQELVRVHAMGMLENSPEDACHFLDASGLAADDVTVWAIRADGELAGMGAMREIDAHHGEVKSMRTAETFLGRGVGRRILGHILDEARTRGYQRVSLETGSTEGFAAACHLYESEGFERCAAFSGYEDNDFSRFYSLDLTAARTA